ncbi:hypothetical protein GGX14DRAFT_310934, partial [Mycena pura]
YFRRTDSFDQLVGLCCKVFYPVAHREHREAFEAGKREDLDPGPFLGRVIVWGLPVGIHRDGLDKLPTLTTDNGFFSGGDMPLPDFRCKFRYERGSIGFGYYEALYHSVEPWKPTPPPKYMAEGRVTSGRMSTVFFSPAKALNMLKGQDSGWLVESGGAVNPN